MRKQEPHVRRPAVRGAEAGQYLSYTQGSRQEHEKSLT